MKMTEMLAMKMCQFTLRHSGSRFAFSYLIENRELNNLRVNYRSEKIKLFQYMNFRLDLSYDSKGAWHTLYAMLLAHHN